MSSIGNNSKFNSSNDDNGEIVSTSRSHASNSGFMNQVSVAGAQIPPSGVDGMITDKYGKSSGEMDLKDSHDQNVMEELGLNLGRRLARLEIGNKMNIENLEKIKERCKIKEKTQAMVNSRVNDLEGKLISMEARLVSEEKQGFDAKERIESLERTLKMKDKEMAELSEIFSKMDAKRDKEEERFSKLKEGSGQLTQQFIVLLETCETFNEELQALKKINIELRRELNKKEMAQVSCSGEISSSAPISDSGGQKSQNAIKPEGLTNVKSDHRLFCHKNVQTSTTVQTSQNVSVELENKWREKAEKRSKWSPEEIKELKKDQVCTLCISHKCFVQNYALFPITKTWKCKKNYPKKEVNNLPVHNSAAYRSVEVEMKANRSKSPNQSIGDYTQECNSNSQPSGYYTQQSSSKSQNLETSTTVQTSQNVSAELEKKWREKAEKRSSYRWSPEEIKELKKDQVCMLCISHKCFVQNYPLFPKTKTWKCQKNYPKKEMNNLPVHNSAADRSVKVEVKANRSKSPNQSIGYYTQECNCNSQPSGHYTQQSSSKSQHSGYYGPECNSNSQPSGYYTPESSSKSPPSVYYAQESCSNSQPSGYYSQGQCQPSVYYAQESCSNSQPSGYYSQDQCQPSVYYAQESTSESHPISYYAQEFVPKNGPGYCYSGPSGPEPYYYTTATQPTFMDSGVRGDLSGYQNHEYGLN